MGIKAGDKLEWKMDTHNNERTAIVTKKPDHIGSVELTRYSMKQKRKMMGDS
ncbi:MAG: hypothetical protein WCA39_05270 [Nitrososphaeraceae archaeon]